MKYYVTTDIHGFFDELKLALTKAGFFEDTAPHKLIICGDIFDRGKQAVELQEFILDLMERDEVILIRGNHEDLMLRLLNGWHRGSYVAWYHTANGTLDTVFQLTGYQYDELMKYPDMIGKALLDSPFIQKIIPSMLDYYETSKYIFVHGWIPATPHSDEETFKMEYHYNPNWRTETEEEWNKARWLNGMEVSHQGCIEKDKEIVCGHWHCSFGHAHYENKGGEFDNHPDFTPYYGKGIIALDACTASSRFVNCIVIEDEPLSESEEK